MAKNKKTAQEPEAGVRMVRSRGLFLSMACYVLLSVFDLGFVAASGSRVVYLVVLAVLGFLATYGLFMLKRWGLWLAVAVSILGITVGIATLYASVIFLSGDSTLLNTILTGYTALNIITLLYLCVKRKIFS